MYKLSAILSSGFAAVTTALDAIMWGSGLFWGIQHYFIS
jgi:hypothetical protein